MSINEIAKEHAQDGWDGACAPAVQESTLRKVAGIIQSLPSDIPSPELTIEPDDGSIGLEWYGGYRKNFTISVNSGNSIPYSGMDGSDVIYGVGTTKNDQLPPFAINCIRSTIEPDF